MDVGGWLRRLGLEQYEATFRENEISEKVLPNLTAEDLKDPGVRFVGHRRMLLDAIAALRAEASAPTPLSDAPLATDNAAKDSKYTTDMQDAVSSRTRSVSRSETVKQAYRGRDQHPSRFFRATRLICRTLFHLEPVP
jgi:hypothetical protein